MVLMAKARFLAACRSAQVLTAGRLIMTKACEAANTQVLRDREQLQRDKAQLLRDKAHDAAELASLRVYRDKSAAQLQALWSVAAAMTAPSGAPTPLAVGAGGVATLPRSPLALPGVLLWHIAERASAPLAPHRSPSEGPCPRLVPLTEMSPPAVSMGGGGEMASTTGET
jgi:hypothetical protein